MAFRIEYVRPTPLLQDRGKHPSEIWDTAWSWEKRSRLLVLAASGRGKSTLVHAMYGLRKDYEGSISLDGQLLNSLDPNTWSDLRARPLSIVFQDLRLFPELTAMENCQVKALIQEKEMDDAIKRMADSLGVYDVLNQAARTLSYGQQQRIAIIRALLQPFEWLLLDEPFSHLDAQNTEKAAALISETCQERGAGVMMVSLGEDYQMTWDQRRNL